MKKYLFIVASLAMSLSASAQSFFSSEKSSEPITYGVRLGVNFASMSGKDVKEYDGRTGFHTGVVVDIPYLESLYFQTGLYYTQKGIKSEDNDEGSKEKVTINPSYLEIPVLASYRYNVSDNAQLQFNVGPYFAYGIGGKVKREESYNGQSRKGELDFFGDGDDQAGGKRFDFGLQVGLGFTFSKSIYAGLAYELGLSKAIKDSDAKNNNFLISVGYSF